MAIVAHPLICVQPEELKFQFELEKQSYCDLKVTNNTEHHVAFKVKTTSPKKYFVRPNTCVIHPWDSCVIRVTLQAQRECPPNMQCKDKFLVQSNVVPPNTNVDEIPLDTFNKEVGDTVQECKLRVIYTRYGESRDDNYQDSDDNEELQRLKDEREAAVRQLRELQQDLEIYKRRRGPKHNHGFTIKFALLMGLIGITMGLLINFLLSSPSEIELSTGPKWSDLDRARIGPIDMKSSLVHDETQINSLEVKPNSAQVQTGVGPLEVKPNLVKDRL